MTQMDFEEHWEQIEEYFDFDIVYTAMKATDWHWGLNANGCIPSVEMIKAKARDLCKKAYDKKGTVGSGGFDAHYEDDVIYLSFTLESWETG